MDKTDQLPLSFFPAPVPTLDSFVVGSNFEAFNIVKELSEGRGPQIVYLFGESGTGKTHLLTTLENLGRQFLFLTLKRKSLWLTTFKI